MSRYGPVILDFPLRFRVHALMTELAKGGLPVRAVILSVARLASPQSGYLAISSRIASRRIILTSIRRGRLRSGRTA